MKIILNSAQVASTIEALAASIADRASHEREIAVVGVRSRGEILALRLSKLLAAKLQQEIPCGTLDITLYRDDLNEPAARPQVRSTEIDFDIDGKIIILVDDVLYTGRSVRAAMDALIDLGRPKAIRLAVLVERPGREYPIGPDYIGIKLNVEPRESVQVNFIESDGKDQVVVE